MSKVVVVTKQSMFEDLKQALNKIGVTGLTVTQVLGCGVQKGASEYYRGVKVDMDLLPKVKVEVVVSKVPVAEVSTRRGRRCTPVTSATARSSSTTLRKWCACVRANPGTTHCRTPMTNKKPRSVSDGRAWNSSHTALS